MPWHIALTGRSRIEGKSSWFAPLNVSLFDVSDLSAPKMRKRVAFGAKDLGEDYAILNYEVAEDQDRIQKAFKVFADGIVAVPFTSTSYSNADACKNPASGVQLFEYKNDTIVKRALLPVVGNPRRALENGQEMIAVSDSNIRSFSLASLDVAKQTADLTIGTCVAKSLPQFGGNGGNGGADPMPNGQMGGWDGNDMRAYSGSCD